MLDEILKAHATIQKHMQLLLATLTDLTVPLDDRWATYTALVENHILVREKSCGDGFLGEIFGHSAVSLYDDFNLDRNQTSTFPEIWDAMNDEFFEARGVYDDGEKRNAWRERVLASGFSGFEYDW